MKPQQFLMLVVALVCGLGAMIMTQRFLNNRDKTEPVNRAKVVVAAGNISPGQVINENMIRVVDYNQEDVPEGAVVDANEVIGKSVRYPMTEKQIFVESIFPTGGGKGIAAILEEGKRAMTVPTTADRAVAGFVKPDDHVDIIVNVKARGPQQLATSKIILQDVRVLAVDTSMKSEGTPDDQGKVVEMVTFLVTPEESELLTLAQNSGAISLVLRNPGDTAVVKTKGASLEQVLSGKDEEEDEEIEPEKFFADGNKSSSGGGLMSFLDNVLSKQKEKEAEAELAKATEIETEVAPVAETVPVVQEPKKVKKWLVYRDVEGKELMRVLVDADSDIAARLKDQLEDYEDEGSANPTEPAIQGDPVAFPGRS